LGPGQFQVSISVAADPDGSARSGIVIIGDQGYRVFQQNGIVGPISSTYYFPHLAIGGGFQTTLTYVNYSPQSVSCQTTFYSDSGGALQVPLPMVPFPAAWTLSGLALVSTCRLKPAPLTR
jgi:hypothetical protein